MRKWALASFIALIGGTSTVPAFCQDVNYPNNYQNNVPSYNPGYNSGGFNKPSLNSMLNQVEQSTNWAQTPAHFAGPVSPTMNTGQMASNMGRSTGMMSPGAAAGMVPTSPMGFGGSPMGAYGSRNPMAMMPGGASPFAPFGGMRQPLQSGPPPFSRQALLRTFFGGGTGSGGGFGGSSGSSGNSAEQQANNANITGQAEAMLQRARDQAAQAESDAARASEGSDKGARQAAASSAQYHANYAREAADQAASNTYNGPAYAQDYAQQARNEANRAQEAADRARYNAEQ